MYLENINGPQDLKGFTAEQRKALAGEMREAMLQRASVHGGHFGPDFGIVDVSPSELIQFSDRSTGSKPLGIWAFGRWLPLGGLLFCPEIGGVRAAGVHTVLTMHTLLTIAGGYR